MEHAAEATVPVRYPDQPSRSAWVAQLAPDGLVATLREALGG